MPDKSEAQLLFDARWYRATYPDSAGMPPYKHFQRIGTAKGHDPNPLFSTSWYLARYPDVAETGATALEDYVTRGVALGRDPGPLFSTRWYLQTVPGLRKLGQNPLAYYFERGFRELYDPSPVFNSAWYFATYPEAAGRGLDALLHYLHEGASRGYSPGPDFDLAWYLDTYPDVAESGMNPLLHYLLQGAAKGFDPNPDFSTEGYLASHPSVRESGDNALVEYLYRRRSRMQNGEEKYGGRYRLPSEAALGEAHGLIEAFSVIEPDLAALPRDLTAVKMIDITPRPAELAWRDFYLSLQERPRTILLIDSIDGTPDLGEVLDATTGLLIVETDALVPSIADALPSGTGWRSFSEFHPGINDEDRLRLTTALVNGLQPETVVIWGSRSGWEMLGHHGKALGRTTAIFALDRPVAGLNATDMMRRYLRHNAPVLSGILSCEPDRLRELACLFGLSPKDRGKIRREWSLSSLASRHAVEPERPA
jgi:hypothetical protein